MTSRFIMLDQHGASTVFVTLLHDCSLLWRLVGLARAYAVLFAFALAYADHRSVNICWHLLRWPSLVGMVTAMTLNAAVLDQSEWLWDKTRVSTGRNVLARTRSLHWLDTGAPSKRQTTARLCALLCQNMDTIQPETWVDSSLKAGHAVA
jgi:hypothetical protein